MADEEEKLAATKARVAGEMAAEEQKLEKARLAVSKFMAVTRANCEEQLKILQRLEELVPEDVAVKAEAAAAPRGVAAQEAPAPAEEPVPEAAEEEPAAPAEAEAELTLDQDFFTTPLPTLEDIKKVQAKQQADAEPLEEDIAANVQAAMDELSVEGNSMWDSLPEDATRVINLDELQFGRNYKKEK